MGVIRTRVGYAGGTKDDPTYTNLEDHTEVISVDYDDEIISYRELLDIFFSSHRPDLVYHNDQYKSLVLYRDDNEYDTIKKLIKEIEEQKRMDIYTTVQRFERFYLAENYHQKYYLQNVMEIMREYERLYPKYKDFINSTETAHVNGYIKGYGTIEKLENDSIIRLSDKAMKRLKQIVRSYD